MNAWAIARSMLLALSAVFCISALERAYVSSPEQVPRTAIPSVNMTIPPAPMSADSLTVLSDRIADADVFRLARRPSPIAFGTNATGDTPSQAKPAKPSLALSGIIGGPPWIAILDGVPGHDQGVSVRAHDSIEGLQVRSVAPDHVVIVGLDSTWRFTVHRPWP